MTVVALPRDQYGTFYEADAYIVYAASPYRQPIGVDTVVSVFLLFLIIIIVRSCNFGNFSPKKREEFRWSSTYISG